MQRRWRRRQREWQKSNRLRQAKQQLCTCITLFCTFLCRRCTTTTWNCLISRFVEDGNKRQQLSFSFPELWCSPLEFNSKKIANNWRIKRDRISAIKFEAAQIHFLSDVFVAVAVVVITPSFYRSPSMFTIVFSPYSYHVRKKRNWKWTFEEVSRNGAHRKENSRADGL